MQTSQTLGNTGRHVNRTDEITQADRQANIQTGGHADRLADKPDRQTQRERQSESIAKYMLTGRQAGRQTARQAGSQTHKTTCVDTPATGTLNPFLSLHCSTCNNILL